MAADLPLDIPLARPEVGGRELAALAAVLESRRLSFGECLPRFESAMATVAAAGGGAGVNSGTSGLQLVLEALGVGRGDEVITVSYTFVGTVNSILHTGARPVLVDVDASTLNMDPLALEAAIGPRTRAVIVVHLFGRPAPMNEILALTRPRAIPVIEDACEALGARDHGRPVGGLGEAGVFGFYPNKPVTTGEGGMVVSGNQELLATVRRLRNQGFDPASGRWQADRAGYSMRLSELQAAVGLAQLERLEDSLKRRSAVARAYHQCLAGERRLGLQPLARPGQSLAWFTFPVQLPRPGIRDRVRQGLAAAGIGSGVYFRPVHQLPFHRELHVGCSLPVSEGLGEHSLALPLFPEMTRAQVERVCARLIELLD